MAKENLFRISHPHAAEGPRALTSEALWVPWMKIEFSI
jgi:hypothetical protein